MGSELLRCVVQRAGEPRADGTVYDERGLMAAAGQFNLTHDEETDGRMDVAPLDDGTPALFWTGPETAVELVGRPCPMGAPGCRVDARGYHRRADGSLGIHAGAIPLEEKNVVQAPGGSFLIPDTPEARAAAERAIRDLGIVPDAARSETSAEAFARKSNLALLEEASGEDWREIESAPRDGTWVEIRNDYGIRPWFALARWVSGKGWRTKDGSGYISEAPLRWRPYCGEPETYVDPTGGAQNSPEYWRAALRGDFDAPRIGHRGDDSIPWKEPVLEPNPEFGPRRISDPLRPIFTGDRRDPRDFGAPFLDRPLPVDWSDRAPTGRRILLLALFRAGIGLAFLAALLLLAAKLSGFTRVLGLEAGAPGRSGALVEPPMPSPLPTRAPSAGAFPRATAGALALLAFGMAYGGGSRDTSVVRGRTRATSARDAIIRECRSEGCDQKIVFLKYTKRDGSETRLPINLTPEAERRARADESWEPNHPDLISHHSTCPFAEDWRKKRGGTGSPRGARR